MPDEGVLGLGRGGGGGGGAAVAVVAVGGRTGRVGRAGRRDRDDARDDASSDLPERDSLDLFSTRGGFHRAAPDESNHRR